MSEEQEVTVQDDVEAAPVMPTSGFVAVEQIGLGKQASHFRSGDPAVRGLRAAGTWTA
jgi:hypothetical protein